MRSGDCTRSSCQTSHPAAFASQGMHIQDCIGRRWGPPHIPHLRSTTCKSTGRQHPGAGHTEVVGVFLLIWVRIRRRSESSGKLSKQLMFLSDEILTRSMQTRKDIFMCRKKIKHLTYWSDRAGVSSWQQCSSWHKKIHDKGKKANKKLSLLGTQANKHNASNSPHVAVKSLLRTGLDGSHLTAVPLQIINWVYSMDFLWKT